jgi:UDP-glucose 4-epimerase
MKVLVTGGAGFIGSNVVDGLIGEGHQVLVVDDLSSGKRANVNPMASFYEMDIRSPELPALLKEERPEVVNHHAAQISVPASVADPVLDADINIKGLLNVLEGAVSSGVRKVVFISSGGAIYGEAGEYPTSENCSPKPLSPYAVAKYASEYYLDYYKHQHGLDYTTLRYANIYGPRQIPHGEAGVVAIFMDNILSGEPSLLYHFPREEEGMVRDYCFVGDVVLANIAALEGASGEYVNIGTGVGTRTLALYGTIVEAFRDAGQTVPRELEIPEQREARPGDLTRSCLRVEKAGHLLGWVPATDLKQGIQKTLAWRLEQKD